MDRRKFTVEYFNAIERALRIVRKRHMQQIGKIVDTIRLAHIGKSTIFIFGNGGSASTASHFACDLSKGCGLRAISLTDSVPLVTAYANDVDYPHVFVGQLQYLLVSGDIVIGISGSGNSENVLQAITHARINKGVTIGMTGFKGGKLKKLVDISLVVPSNNMQHIEDVHLILCHLISRMIKEELKK